MTSIIKLQALSGVDGESPPCYLLQVDEFCFLLDCGWDETCGLGYIDNFKKHVQQIDAVLLTYPDPQHLGALPYMVGKGGLNCPIYATIPVYKMGQMFMYDLYQSRHNTEEFNMFTLDDVDAAFDKILQLKYSQTVSLKGKGHGLQITPFPAGHMIGGTIWKIVKDGEEEIVYAIDYNHKKERHLNGCVLDTIGRPHILITDAYNADYVQARRRLRDEQLITNILQTMRNDGNVLVAVDTAGRVLELAQLLDQMWCTQESGLMAYSLALLNNVSYNVIEFAKSQVEWMSDKIMRAFEDRRSNPFQFKHLQLCHSLAELSQVPEPKVVLASGPDLQSGFSRDLFIQWCTDAKNCVILTNRTPPGTLARQLMDNPGQRNISVRVKRRVRLEAAELEEHLTQEKEAKAAQKAEFDKNRDDPDLESSDDSGTEMDTDEVARPRPAAPPAAGAVVKTAKHDLMMKSEGKARTGFFKQVKKAYPMFPLFEDRIKWDEYGEIIRAEDFIILDTVIAEEEKMETSVTEDPNMKDISEVPTKCIETVEKLEVLANVMFIDFEGRSDGESLRKILAQTKPRELILVHGSREAATSLANFCRNARDIVQGRVFVPRLNEIVDATTESHIFQVKLKDSLVSSLKFSPAKDMALAWVNGRLDLSKAKLPYDNENGADTSDDPVDLVPTLLPVPRHLVRGHAAVFLNEPKLSDLKQVLLKEGIQAEFSAGVLICNNQVAVRRNEAGRLQLEGCLCNDYYIVRDLLYEQYAIL